MEMGIRGVLTNCIIPVFMAMGSDGAFHGIMVLGNNPSGKPRNTSSHTSFKISHRHDSAVYVNADITLSYWFKKSILKGLRMGRVNGV